MRKSRNSLKLLAFVLIIVLLKGCTYHVQVKQDKITAFQERPERFPLSVGLYLSNETRKHVIEKHKMGATFEFLIGDAIEASAPESIKMIFPKMSIIHDKASMDVDIERIITIQFGPATNVTLGATPISEHAAIVELLCEVYDKEWNSLWKGSVREKVARKPSAGVVLGGLMGNIVLRKELGMIIDECLITALEQLNEQIVTSGKDIMF